MSTTDQTNQVIARLQENIRRLECTIGKRCWQKGYVENCKATIASYKAQIADLESTIPA
jgi:hypothetical protein